MKKIFKSCIECDKCKKCMGLKLDKCDEVAKCTNCKYNDDCSFISHGVNGWCPLWSQNDNTLN